jgi:hypothetical protein
MLAVAFFWHPYCGAQDDRHPMQKPDDKTVRDSASELRRRYG